MRIGLLTDLTAVNSAYRALPILQLQRRGHELSLGMEGTRWQPARLRGCDVVHIHRYHDRPTRQLVEQLCAGGTAIVWDNDDELTDVPGERRKDGLSSQRVQTELRALLQLTHVVTTPSRVLAERYREWGAAHVEVVENYLPEDFAVAGESPRREGVTIGWTAGAEHRHDLLQLGLREVLIELLAAHPELHVRSVGIHLGLPHDRYTHQSLVQYDQLARHVATFDVGIAPLADVAFNRARSNVKLKEYAAMGVPWLASPVGPYAGLGPKQGGQLVADDGWHAALDRLVRDARLRGKLAGRGVKWARGQTVAANLAAWERPLALAVERARHAHAATA